MGTGNSERLVQCSACGQRRAAEVAGCPKCGSRAAMPWGREVAVSDLPLGRWAWWRLRERLYATFLNVFGVALAIGLFVLMMKVVWAIMTWVRSQT